MIMLDGALGGFLLRGAFELELVDLADRQALGQVIKRAVFVASVMAMTIGLATTGETFDQGGPQRVGIDFELGEQETFAVAQGEGGFGGVVYPSHVYGEDIKIALSVNKKRKWGQNAKMLR